MLTAIAACLALLGAAATVAYLDPVSTGTWVNLLFALAVLVTPLITRAPLTGLRLVIAFSIWLALGLPGGYFFGTPVFYSSVLLGAALIVHTAISHIVAKAGPETTTVGELGAASQ